MQRDNEGFYGVPADESNALAGLGMACCPCDGRGCAILLLAASFHDVCALSDLSRPHHPRLLDPRCRRRQVPAGVRLQWRCTRVLAPQQLPLGLV